MSDAKRKLNLEQAKKFLFGGNSTFTVVSKKSKKRYTFKAKKGKGDDAPYFVSFLNGPDNYSNYNFIGSIFNENEYRYSKKSNVGFKSEVNQTFSWVFNVLKSDNQSKFDLIEFWHEGKCAKCGRKLTDPDSIKRGFGPVCHQPTQAEVKMKKRVNKIDKIFKNDK